MIKTLTRRRQVGREGPWRVVRYQSNPLFLPTRYAFKSKTAAEDYFNRRKLHLKPAEYLYLIAPSGSTVERVGGYTKVK